MNTPWEIIQVDMDELQKTLESLSTWGPVPSETVCECGAFKASGISKHAPGHSAWCPWAERKAYP